MSVFSVQGDDRKERKMNDCMTLISEEITMLEQRREGRYAYALYRISIGQNRNYYAVEVSDGNIGELEVVGKNGEDAERIYRMLADARVAFYNLFEVVSDIKNGRKYS